MGFRSTFVTAHYKIKWPDWFVTKYAEHVHFNPEGNSGQISSKVGAKTDGLWDPLPDDIRRAIDWDDFRLDYFELVFLHECGGITRCEVSRNDIAWSEPEGWVRTPGVTHRYCYGCSDAPPFAAKEGDSK